MTSTVFTRGHGRSRWSVDPADGGRLVSLVVDDHELIAQPGDVVVEDQSMLPYLYGAYPMIPWAGRIRDGRFRFADREYTLPVRGGDHAMHGTTYDRPWQVTATDEQGLTMTCDLGSWPFAGEATMTWRGDGAGLSLRLAVLAHEAMPVWLGIHPWFRRVLDDGNAVRFAFDAKQLYVRGPDGLPTGERVDVVGGGAGGPWDDCFAGVTQATLAWGALELTMTASSDIWVVFDEQPAAVCFEPQTAPPDALALGEAPWLAAGDTHALDVRLDWHQP